jgi:type II secretory pathway component PulF
MQTFRYEALGQGGAVATGTLSAPDRGTAMRQLEQQGVVPVLVEPLGGTGAGAAAAKAAGAAGAAAKGATRALDAIRGRSSDRPTISRTEMANFVRELGTAIEAGLPLMQALKTVRKQAHGKALPVILDFVIEQVEAGKPLHQAAKEYGPPFDDLVLGMFRAADASGRMHEVLNQLADLLDRAVELRREIVGATVYPVIVLTLLMASVIVLVTFVLPRLMEGALNRPGIVLPFPTRVLLGMADFFGSWWWAVIVGAALSIVGFRTWIRRPANRMVVDIWLLRVPLLGTLLRDVAVARFTRTLGTLVSAGIPILSALRVVRDTLGNAAMMSAIDQVQERVMTGTSLADPLERSGFFPPLLVQIVAIGEKSGRLESMLMHAAGAFDRQVNSSLKVFTKALPPVLLCIMAVVAGFVLAGILLPLLQAQSLAGG